MTASHFGVRPSNIGDHQTFLVTQVFTAIYNNTKIAMLKQCSMVLWRERARAGAKYRDELSPAWRPGATTNLVKLKALSPFTAYSHDLCMLAFHIY